MKTEDSPQPPATPYTTTQWSATSQIPIDPALQQQSQTQANAAYYQQYYQQYSHQYQHYVPPQTAQPVPAPVKPAAAPVATVDTTDVSKLNDALGSAGVDLRAEEETLQRSFDQYHAYRPYEDRSHKQPAKPNFDTRFLGAKIREIANKNKVSKVPEDGVNYIALALRFRLQELIEAMIAASAHRTDAQFERPASFYDDGSPMWSIVVRADVAKQLAAIEKVEREEEMKIRRERKERQDAQAAHAQQMAAQASGSAMAVDGEMEEGPKKKKKKADGPGVTARNMSEDVRKKMSNAVASQAAGLSTGKYAWMNASAAAAAPPPKAKPAASSATTGALSPATTTTPAASTSGSRWARPYVPSSKSAQSTTGAREEDSRRTVTLRDAMFVVEKERGHGGGRGSARGWT